MAFTLNKVILIGYVGKDAEVRYTNNGLCVMKFSLATNQNVKNIDGNWEKSTTWHDIVAFGKLAENLKDYMKKGRRIYLEGKITKRDFVDKQNIKRYVTEIWADSIQLMDKPPEGEIESEEVKIDEDVELPSDDTSIKESEEDIPF